MVGCTISCLDISEPLSVLSTGHSEALCIKLLSIHKTRSMSRKIPIGGIHFNGQSVLAWNPLTSCKLSAISSLIVCLLSAFRFSGFYTLVSLPANPSYHYMLTSSCWPLYINQKPPVSSWGYYEYRGRQGRSSLTRQFNAVFRELFHSKIHWSANRLIPI